MSNHESNGRFAKGNNAARISNEVREFKAHCKEDLYKAIASLRLPMKTLKADLERNNVSRWEYIVAKSISKGDYRFFQWLYEMVLGRAPQTITKDEDINDEIKIVINNDDELL